jgi:hypothetical protein
VRRAVRWLAIAALVVVSAVSCGSSSTKTPTTDSTVPASTASTLRDQDTVRDGSGDGTPDTLRDQDRTQLSNP